MLADVGERALGHAKQGYLDRRWQGRQFAVDMEIGAQADLLGQGVEGAAERSGETRVGKAMWREGCDDAPRLVESLARGGLHPGEGLGLSVRG